MALQVRKDKPKNVINISGYWKGCEKCKEIMRNFQELAFCGRKGLLCGTLCDFSGKDFT